MCDLMCNQYVETGVQNDDLGHIARGGVLIPDIFGVFPKAHDVSLCFLLHTILP